MPVVAAESMKPRNRTSVWLLLYRSRRFSEIGSENRKSVRFEKPLLSAGGISCHSMKAVVANNRALRGQVSPRDGRGRGSDRHPRQTDHGARTDRRA
jgi:hypothetical protein